MGSFLKIVYRIDVYLKLSFDWSFLWKILDRISNFVEVLDRIELF